MSCLSPRVVKVVWPCHLKILYAARLKNQIPAPGILNITFLNISPKYSAYSMSLLTSSKPYNHFVLKWNLTTYKF